MDRKSRHVTEIPCLAVDKLMSIFKPDPDDVYNSGLLIGRRESQGATHPDIAFVHPFSSVVRKAMSPSAPTPTSSCWKKICYISTSPDR